MLPVRLLGNSVSTSPQLMGMQYKIVFKFLHLGVKEVNSQKLSCCSERALTGCLDQGGRQRKVLGEALAAGKEAGKRRHYVRKVRKMVLKQIRRAVII